MWNNAQEKLQIENISRIDILKFWSLKKLYYFANIGKKAGYEISPLTT